MGALVRWLFSAIAVVSTTVADAIAGNGFGGLVLLLLLQGIEGAVIGLLALKAGGLIYKDIDTLSPNLFSIIVVVALVVIGGAMMVVLTNIY